MSETHPIFGGDPGLIPRQCVPDRHGLLVLPFGLTPSSFGAVIVTQRVMRQSEGLSIRRLARETGHQSVEDIERLPVGPLGCLGLSQTVPDVTDADTSSGRLEPHARVVTLRQGEPLVE